MSYTAFHFETTDPKLERDTMSLCALRFVCMTEYSQFTQWQYERYVNRLGKLSIQLKNFPVLWKTFLTWYDGGTLVGRNLQQTFGTLGTLFREHSITPPTGIHCIDLFIDNIFDDNDTDFLGDIGEDNHLNNPIVETETLLTLEFIKNLYIENGTLLPTTPADTFFLPISH
jgi:hypothetical protein